MSKTITVYGTTWCPDCVLAKMVLDKTNTEYTFIDIAESAEAAAKVEEINKGFRSVPTIVFPNGNVMVEPTIGQLQEALKTNQILAVQ